MTGVAAGRHRIPAFGLYGSAAEGTLPGFAHSERIRSRASLHDWQIRPHRHGGLFQALVAVQGGGTLSMDGERSSFTAPWLVWVPAGTVHSFSFEPGTDGFVLSVAEDLVASVIAANRETPGLRDVTEAPFSQAMGSPAEIELDIPAILGALSSEMSGALPGAHGVVNALVTMLLVGIMRTRASHAVTAPSVVAKTDLHRRFRLMADAHLRENWSLMRFAAELGVSTDRLHAACTEAVGKSPQAILHDRLVLEAKRSLTYTNFPVSLIAFELGFKDPAYFSRFFSQRAGASPAVFRKAQSRETTEPSSGPGR